MSAPLAATGEARRGPTCNDPKRQVRGFSLAPASWLGLGAANEDYHGELGQTRLQQCYSKLPMRVHALLHCSGALLPTYVEYSYMYDDDGSR